jgi:hypothetical protein
MVVNSIIHVATSTAPGSLRTQHEQEIRKKLEAGLSSTEPFVLAHQNDSAWVLFWLVSSFVRILIMFREEN